MTEHAIPELRLISHKLCPYVQRARIVLAEHQLPHELTFIDLANKPDWFKSVSPLGKVPVLLVDGQPLFESQVIAEYLDDIAPGSLQPAHALQRAEHKAWAAFASATLDSVAQFYNAADPVLYSRSMATIAERFQSVERALEDGPWFAGERFSIVDAAFAPLFRYFDTFEKFGDFEWFSGLERVHAWRGQLRQRNSVINAVVPDYPQRLERFLAARPSALGELVRRHIRSHDNESLEFVA